MVSAAHLQGIAIKQADPPAAVNDAFKEVTAAQQDAKSYVNQSRAYALQLTAKAQGEAGKKIAAARMEIEKHQERDPLKLFRATLAEEKILSDKEFTRIEEEVKAEIDKAVRFAEESPEPDVGELYTNVYADEQ